MKTYRLPLLIIGMGIVLMVVHFIAQTNALYWKWWWLDLVMHFSGGFLVCLFGLWVLTSIAGPVFVENKQWLFFDVLLFTIIVGLIWEIHEIVFKLAIPTRPEYVFDTVTDSLMNIVGASVAFLYFVRRHFRSTETSEPSIP